PPSIPPGPRLRCSRGKVDAAHGARRHPGMKRERAPIRLDEAPRGHESEARTLSRRHRGAGTRLLVGQAGPGIRDLDGDPLRAAAGAHAHALLAGCDTTAV